MHKASSFPFFAAVEPRALSAEEGAVVDRLLVGQAPQYVSQRSYLRVVGRCGCLACPTVFFAAPTSEASNEQDLVSLFGKDSAGGLVAAVLLHNSDGALSQLEFYSVDGHEPWAIPRAESLAVVNKA